MAALFQELWSELCTEPGRVGEGDGEESRIASSNTSPDYARFSGYSVIPEGIGGPLRNESGSSEPRHFVLNGIICVSARYRRLPCDAVNQAIIKAQLAVIAGN